jgi:hypothetical protein
MVEDQRVLTLTLTVLLSDLRMEVCRVQPTTFMSMPVEYLTVKAITWG